MLIVVFSVYSYFTVRRQTVYAMCVSRRDVKKKRCMHLRPHFFRFYGQKGEKKTSFCQYFCIVGGNGAMKDYSEYSSITLWRPFSASPLAFGALS